MWTENDWQLGERRDNKDVDNVALTGQSCVPAMCCYGVLGRALPRWGGLESVPIMTFFI